MIFKMLDNIAQKNVHYVHNDQIFLINLVLHRHKSKRKTMIC